MSLGPDPTEEVSPTAPDWEQPGFRPNRRIAGWSTNRIAAVAIACIALVAVAIWQAWSVSPSTSSDPLVGRTGMIAPKFSIPEFGDAGP